MSHPDASPAAAGATTTATPVPFATGGGSREIISPVKLYFFDTDAAGVVHNVAYLRLIEVVRTELAAQVGWTAATMVQTGLVPVVARTEIDYLRSVKLTDDIDIWGAMTRIEAVRFMIDFEVRPRGGRGEVFARCRQTMVIVKLPEGIPQRVPRPWREAFPEIVAKREKRNPGATG